MSALTLNCPTMPEPPAPGDCPSLLGPPGAASRAASTQTVVDLHLDDLIAAMAPGEFQQELWRRPLVEAEAISYRQDVLDDLRRPLIRGAAAGFVVSLHDAELAVQAWREAHYRRPAELSLLNAISALGAAVTAFAQALDTGASSAGLRGLDEWLHQYLAGAEFRRLGQGSAALLTELGQIQVELGLRGPTLWVEPDQGRTAWSAEIETFFARFDGGTSGVATPVPARPRRYLNHVEARGLDLVSQLWPELFERVAGFAAEQHDFLSPMLRRLGEELRFYLGFLTVADQLACHGVAWCRAWLDDSASGSILVSGVVDVALALRLRPGDRPLQPNDLALTGAERIAFITGPNQGGKTTFARSLGQSAYLASLGLLVPASAARLPVLNPVLTHFPQPDAPEQQRGALADEIVRLRTVLDQAGPSALLVLNELFSATSASDAMELSRLALAAMDERESRVLWVTFLEDLVTAVPGAVSLVGQVSEADPTLPTFRFQAQPPAGRFHAAALAARHGLSADDLARRLP